MREYIEKYKGVIMKAILGIILAASLIGGCTMINKKLNVKDDWIGEEIVEGVIKEKLNIDVDLTPETPENEKKK